MTRRLIAIAAVAASTYAAVVTAAPVPAPATSPADPEMHKALSVSRTPPFSEEQNAATGFVATQHLFMNRMATACQPLLNQLPSFPADTAADWRKRENNGRYLNAAMHYLDRLAQAIDDFALFQDFVFYIARDVNASAQASVDDRLKGTKAEQALACRKFLAQLDAGSLDIREGAPFLETLEAMRREFGDTAL